MGKRKFLIGCLIFIVVCLAIFNKSRAVVSQTSDFYVNDSAGVLDNSLKNYIISTNKSLYSQTGAQIVVVTVNSLDGDAIEDYANKLFRQYGIGDSKKNNGVLILLSIQDRKCRIEVGYGLEGTLTDGKTGRIQDDYMVPYFKNDNWQDGIKNGYNAVLEELTPFSQSSSRSDPPVLQHDLHVRPRWLKDCPEARSSDGYLLQDSVLLSSDNL